jgi:hypothetical protein
MWIHYLPTNQAYCLTLDREAKGVVCTIDDKGLYPSRSELTEALRAKGLQIDPVDPNHVIPTAPKE